MRRAARASVTVGAPATAVPLSSRPAEAHKCQRRGSTDVSPVPRRLALPLVVLASPPLFLLYREVRICGTPVGCRSLALAGYALVLLAALLAAATVARRVAAGRAPGWLAPRPDDRTLGVLAAIVGALAAFLVAAAAGVVPGWLGDALAPVGVLLGFPLVVVQAVLVGVGNAVGIPPRAVQLLAVVVGVGLSGAWWYLLAGSAARWLSRVVGPRE